MKKTIEYIIKTEYKRIDAIHIILAQFGISSYSMYKIAGCWGGIVEDAMAIQIIDTGVDKVDPVIIECIACEIKVRLDQECVLVEKRELFYSLI